jgi:hypothetical protein
MFSICSQHRSQISTPAMAEAPHPFALRAPDLPRKGRGIAYRNFRFQYCASTPGWIRKLGNSGDIDSNRAPMLEILPICDSPAAKGEGKKEGVYIGVLRP